MKVKKIAILGSTGSVGCSTLDVVSACLDGSLQVVAMSCGRNITRFIDQIATFKPLVVSIADEKDVPALRSHFPDLDIYCGDEGLRVVATCPEADIVVSALVGARGIHPTLAAIEAKKDIALANKEVLVTAGAIVMEAVRQNQVQLIPVDSEHSAIFQVFKNSKSVRNITLTASGGPFLRRPLATFASIQCEEALKHPQWKMGNRITIDSATLMNKGFEVIEAYWLFGLDPKQIEVVVHPQSIVHGMVTFCDGNSLACLSVPDMKAPIAYALSYPDRIKTEVPALDLAKVGQITFEAPDTHRFPLLKLAYTALKCGGVYPGILNAADEVTVQAFLDGKISFVDISCINETVLSNFAETSRVSLSAVLEADRWARAEATTQIKQLSLNQ